MIKFYCTYCGQCIEASEELASAISVCPSCGKEIKVPRIQSDRLQDPVHDAAELTSEFKAPEIPREPGFPATRTKADTSLGGKMLSLVGSGILILVLVLFSRQCGGFIGKQAAERKLETRAATLTDQPSAQGTLVEFDLVGLMIKLPGRPNERTIPMPDAVKATLKSKDSFLYQNGTQTISVNRDVFVEEFNFSSRCDIVFDQLKNLDSNADQKQYPIDGLGGRCFTFDAGDGTHCELLVFSRGATLWQVQILDRASRSDSAKVLSETIFSSIKISP